MFAIIWKWTLFKNEFGFYEFLFILFLAAVAISFIYAVDFIYRKLKR